MKKILLILVFSLSFLLIGCSYNNTDDLGLSTVTDANDLKQLLKKTNSKSVPGNSRDDSVDLEEGAPSSDYQSSDYTKTNVQVEGVDEGDIMKTDGSRIYTISWDRIQVIQLLGNGEMDLILNEKIESAVPKDNFYSYTYYSELYVTDKYLVVIGQRYGYSYNSYEKDDVIDSMPFYYNYTIMSIVDIYDKQSLEKVDNYEVSGYLLGSRLINDQLYLISNHYAYLYEENDTEFDVRPWYKHNNLTSYFDYEDIKYIPDALHQSFTVISTIILEQDITIDNNVFLSANSWGHIYVSTNSIYFASNYYQRSIFGNYEQRGMLISFQIEKNTGKVFYGGYGNYQGYIINQFAMDEYNGFMRIATTDGWGENVKNRLYIFKRTLKDDTYKLETISYIDSGLGKPGERIQSVRFNKDIATIVTFLQTDPFYTIDISDPYNPEIAGELEIPGFSTYQHPWTDDLVIGIGFDANDNGTVTGMKLSLYDITDISNPKEIGKPLVFNNGQSEWTFSEATYNHKAVMIDKSRNSFGFSLYRYGWWQESKRMNDYLIFDVDENREQPIQVKYSVSHEDYYNTYSDLYTNYWYYDFQIKRAFRVDDYLYVVSGEVITSHNLLGDETVVDEIIFQEFYINK